MLRIAKKFARTGRGQLVVVNYSELLQSALCDAVQSATDLRRRIEDSGVLGVAMPKVSPREGREDSRA